MSTPISNEVNSDEDFELETRKKTDTIYKAKSRTLRTTIANVPTLRPSQLTI